MTYPPNFFFLMNVTYFRKKIFSFNRASRKEPKCHPPPHQGEDLKNNQMKQLNNSIWVNRKVETKLYFLSICPNKIV